MKILMIKHHIYNINNKKRDTSKNLGNIPIVIFTLIYQKINLKYSDYHDESVEIISQQSRESSVRTKRFKETQDFY